MPRLLLRLVISISVLLALPSLLFAQKTLPADSGDAGTVRVLYTGKLFGYFRVPDAQPPRPGAVCPDGDNTTNSAAVGQFEKIVKDKKLEKFILVGMGDNFAPEIEARKFCAPPDHQFKTGHQHKIASSPYNRSGKEFFAWDDKNHVWQTNEYIGESPEADAKNLEKSLAVGRGLIPSDNVADFLVREGYAAVVPGKHDFYFGAERLRELAVYLANEPIANENSLHGRGVQMLGANLVIETTWRKGHQPLSDKKAPPWFIPRFPTASDLIGDASSEIGFSGLSEGGNVYPWFMGPHLSIKAKATELNAALAALTYRLCKLADGGDLDKPPAETACFPLELTKDEGKAADSETLQYQIVRKDPTPWQTLDPDTNYLFCAEASGSKVKPVDRTGHHNFCLHFSVYEPLLQYPSQIPPACRRENCERPEPFVLLEKKQGLAQDVAIFGAIDPHLLDYVGLLNVSWKNTEDRFNTKAAVKDPAEALREMNEYFEANYRYVHHKPFQGIKVLLAQMTPETAEILAARLGNYQVIVSEADPERATYDHKTELDWSSTGLNKKNQTRFVAVPEPFYDGARKTQSSPWNVDLGSLTIASSSFMQGNWHLTSEHLESPVQYVRPNLTAYSKKLSERLPRDCYQGQAAAAEDAEKIEWLTLCAIQHASEADVAILQKRDFFSVIGLEPRAKPPETPRYELQDLVERIVWKGDFMTVNYLSGSTLQKIMTQSKGFDSDDSSSLSLADETGRGLLAIGIRYDSDHSEYVVNGRPLDPGKLYSVVSSDFVTGGDTGYPDIASSQLDPASGPGDLDARLEKISSLVCRTLADDPGECLGDVDRVDYFDDFEGKPLQVKRTETNGKAFKRWTIFFPAGAVPGNPAGVKPPLPAVKDATDKAVEGRPL